MKSKQSKLYIMRYPDESPVVYKIGSSTKPNSRLTSLFKVHPDVAHRMKERYPGRIEVYAVYFISNARDAETWLARTYSSKRIERERAISRFGTMEVYELSELDLRKITELVKVMYMEAV